MKLRRKLEDNAAKPRHIITIYGPGYELILWRTRLAERGGRAIATVVRPPSA